MIKKQRAWLGAVVCLGIVTAYAAGIFHRPGVIDVGACGVAGEISDAAEGEYTANPADYPLAGVRGGDGAPRYYVEAFPDIADEGLPVEERKDVFLRAMLPLVLAVNESLQTQRHMLLRLAACQDRGDELTTAALDWLNEMAERYNTKPVPKLLLQRVDIVPPALALAQSAIESGWGQSRFVREGNALFGEHLTGPAGGLKPVSLREDTDVRVAAFERPIDSVIAYARNLNTHRAYAEFRRQRASMRTTERPLDAVRLAGTLHRYSARRGAYVRDIRALIAANNLTDFDRAWLRAGDEGSR